MNIPMLFESTKDCCGCGSCLSACPTGAISIFESADGFRYPRIDNDVCIGCGACKKSCGLQKGIGAQSSGPYYAAVGKGQIENSASGGVFITLARSIVRQGGIVYGAAYTNQENTLLVKHLRVETDAELWRLQNSKYVQSDAGCCFKDLRNDLKRGREVLFSGTPCQVAGLRGYLGRDWPNLTTIDLVCHGVPSQRMFSEMVDAVQLELGGRLTDLRFRCKANGWGHSLLLLLLDDGREVHVPATDFAYYDLFLRLKTLRDSCYFCPYGGSHRAADITIGDFWGIEDRRPDILATGGFDLMNGVSCLLVNNKQGNSFLDAHGAGLELCEVSFEDISAGNSQLRHPSALPPDRDMYLQAFSVGGWRSVEELWKRRERGLKYKVKRFVIAVIPSGLLQFLRRLIR